MHISYYHIDLISGIIALYSINNVFLYTLYKKKAEVLSKFPMEDNIGELPGVNNLLKYSLPQLDCIYMMLASIYDKVYLLFLDGFHGIFRVYKKNEIKYEINIEPGAYGVRVIDNLIILQNYGSQESTVID